MPVSARISKKADELRRFRLVVTIVVPGTDSEIKLVQLAGRVLARANALGT
jgi:hypothetical protein